MRSRSIFVWESDRDKIYTWDFVCEQKAGMPRRPGVYPSGYPRDRILRTAPVPGEPLSVTELSRRRSDTTLSHSNSFDVKSELSVEHRRSRRVERRFTTKTKKPTSVLISQTAEEFPEIKASVPKMKQKQFQYPSGRATGTELWRPFEEKIKELIGTTAGPTFNV